MNIYSEKTQHRPHATSAATFLQLTKGNIHPPRERGRPVVDHGW